MYSKSYPLWNPYFVNDLLLFCFTSTCELFFSSFTFVQMIPFRNSCAREWCTFSSWFSCMTSSQLLRCWKSRSVIMIIISSMELRFALCYNAIYFLVRYTRYYLVVLRLRSFCHLWFGRPYLLSCQVYTILCSGSTVKKFSPSVIRQTDDSNHIKSGLEQLV